MAEELRSLFREFDSIHGLALPPLPLERNVSVSSSVDNEGEAEGLLLNFPSVPTRSRNDSISSSKRSPSIISTIRPSRSSNSSPRKKKLSVASSAEKSIRHSRPTTILSDRDSSLNRFSGSAESVNNATFHRRPPLPILPTAPFIVPRNLLNQYVGLSAPLPSPPNTAETEEIPPPVGNETRKSRTRAHPPSIYINNNFVPYAPPSPASTQRQPSSKKSVRSPGSFGKEYPSSIRTSFSSMATHQPSSRYTYIPPPLPTSSPTRQYKRTTDFPIESMGMRSTSQLSIRPDTEYDYDPDSERTLSKLIIRANKVRSRLSRKASTITTSSWHWSANWSMKSANGSEERDKTLRRARWASLPPLPHDEETMKQEEGSDSTGSLRLTNIWSRIVVFRITRWHLILLCILGLSLLIAAVLATTITLNKN